MNARDWLAVALGGALGALLRVLIGEWSDWGTLIANTLGSGLVGWYLASRFSGTPPRDRFFADGFCGGFTTFAVLSLEAAASVEAGSVWMAVVYIGVTGILAVGAAAMGWRIGAKKQGVRPRSAD